MRTLPFVVGLALITAALVVQQMITSMDPSQTTYLCNGIWGCGRSPSLPDVAFLGGVTLLFVLILPRAAAE